MSGNNETKGRADHVDQLVSKRLKMRRMMLGLSQNDLGDAVDVSIQQVQKYEKATNRISSGKLHAFAKFLKVPVSYFFENNDGTGNLLTDYLAEKGQEYNSDLKNTVSEREIVSLVKAFSEVENPSKRKKIIDLIKAMN